MIKRLYSERQSDIDYMKKIKEILLNRRFLCFLLCQLANALNPRCSIRGKAHNEIEIKAALLLKAKIRVKGKGNKIIIDDFSFLNGCNVNIVGNNNRIIIKGNSNIGNCALSIQDSNNTIVIGERVRIYGVAELSCIEGTNITIGDDCLLSSNIHFRTGDSHSVLDKAGKRINYSRSIVVEKHVWIGRNVILLKGAHVFENSVVGAGSLVTGAIDDNGVGVVLGGHPAKVIRREINWNAERL